LRPASPAFDAIDHGASIAIEFTARHGNGCSPTAQVMTALAIAAMNAP
jgi:hypothetical protein